MRCIPGRRIRAPRPPVEHAPSRPDLRPQCCANAGRAGVCRVGSVWRAPSRPGKGPAPNAPLGRYTGDVVKQATKARKVAKRTTSRTSASSTKVRRSAGGTTTLIETKERRAAPIDKSGLARRADFIVTTLGNGKTASLLHVAQSQPSRWRRAKELPSPPVAPLIVDLDHVIGRLLLLWDPSVVGSWLEGPNPHLTGARPIDVLRTRGSAEVVEAIEAEAEGAFA